MMGAGRRRIVPSLAALEASEVRCLFRCVPFPCAGSGLGEHAAHDSAKGHRAAAGHAGGEVRVLVGEVAAAVVADDEEARDRVALGVDGVHVGVDLDAVHGAEHPARVLGTVEGSLVDGGETVLFLAVVDVLTLAVELVVAGDRGLELGGRKTELLGELFNRVGLLDVALGDQAREHAVTEDLPGNVGLGAVFEREEARAAVHLELFGVLDPVGVEDRVVAVALLIFVGVEDVLVGAGLVHEAPAVGVDLEPGLGADPEKASGAGG